MQKLDLPTDRFLNHKVKIPNTSVFVKDSKHIGQIVKGRFITDYGVENKCSICGIYEWMSKPLVIQLDHINGDHRDNRIENLRLLCPNCHSQTPTYGSKNRKAGSANAQAGNCEDCRAKISIQSVRCKKCYNHHRYKKNNQNRPPLDELLKNVKEEGYAATGRKYGVSDNAVRKWIKTYSKYGEKDPPVTYVEIILIDS